MQRRCNMLATTQVALRTEKITWAACTLLMQSHEDESCFLSDRANYRDHVVKERFIRKDVLQTLS